MINHERYLLFLIVTEGSRRLSILNLSGNSLSWCKTLLQGSLIILEVRNN